MTNMFIFDNPIWNTIDTDDVYSLNGFTITSISANRIDGYIGELSVLLTGNFTSANIYDYTVTVY